jgi:hypothetical protein
MIWSLSFGLCFEYASIMMALAKALGQRTLTAGIIKTTRKLANSKQGIVADKTDLSFRQCQCLCYSSAPLKLEYESSDIISISIKLIILNHGILLH